MSDVLSYYRWTAPIYNLTRSVLLPDRTHAVRQLGLRPGETVLEIGTGTGHNLPLLSDIVGSHGRVIGLDFSPHMIRRAQSRLRRHGLTNVALVCADACRFSLSSSVDAVLFSYSLSMIPLPEQALDSAGNALRAAGRIALVDFGPFDGWGPLGRLMRTWLKLNHVTVWSDNVTALFSRFTNVTPTTRHHGYSSILTASQPTCT